MTRKFSEMEEAAPAEVASRRMRADARRNYDKLVSAAREVFASEGGSASMEAVAKAAGVGVGTLYRHFPRRIDLVQAVYEGDVDGLVQTAQRVVTDLEPWPAVVAFLEACVRLARAKRTFLIELREAFDKDPDMKSRMRDRIDEATVLVIGRAQAAGAVRTDVEPADMMQLLSPMCTSPTLTDVQTVRLLPMILDGLRAGRDAG
ncbi:MAG: TetR/AcrR family transcriptional regulator [Acidimicrobiales bacterium]